MHHRFLQAKARQTKPWPISTPRTALTIINATLVPLMSTDEGMGMDTPLMVSVVGAVAAIAAGVISGIWSPWTKYKIELMMAMRESRRQAIERWRTEIAKHTDDIRTWDGLPEVVEYLEKQDLDDISSNMIFVTTGGPNVDHRRRILLKAIKRVEKEWKLI